MSGAMRRGGIPGPESRTGLVRPAMTEAEFERRQQPQAQAQAPTQAAPEFAEFPMAAEPEPAPRAAAAPPSVPAHAATAATPARSRAARAKPVKPKRVQRMFALEEDLDKKLWLYAIHVGKDRSEVVNDLLRPLVASMVLYDSRDRRAARSVDPVSDREGDGEAA
jgi:hypothetical protein